MLSDAQVTDERMATTGTIDVRIRTDEYTSDEASFFCTASLDRLEDIRAMVSGWGIVVDGESYGGTNSVSGQFAIGRLGTFFELVVNTNPANA